MLGRQALAARNWASDMGRRLAGVRNQIDEISSMENYFVQGIGIGVVLVGWVRSASRIANSKLNQIKAYGWAMEGCQPKKI
jgi:hypothetical protein